MSEEKIETPSHSDLKDHLSSEKLESTPCHVPVNHFSAAFSTTRHEFRRDVPINVADMPSERQKLSDLCS